MVNPEFHTILADRSEQHLDETKGGMRPVSIFAGGIFLLLLTLAGVSLYRVTLPPRDFVPETLIRVPSGYSLADIALLLEEYKVIRSHTLFGLVVSWSEQEKNLRAGDYLFSEPQSVFGVAGRFISGDHGIAVARVMFPEGVTVVQMADILARALPDVEKEAFVEDALPYEGYLFPDTYFFYTTATSGPVIAALRENFELKTQELQMRATREGVDWADVVNLASIVEGEAATAEDRRIIAGILLHRIEIGMRLQVDAPFVYTLGKGSLELLQSDLESDSLYNTYRHEGLPPTPIGNPGLDAIRAVLDPTKTEYLYYLSERDGTMHYAKTFDEHKKNKLKYLP
jgi:UPF0755 protein